MVKGTISGNTLAPFTRIRYLKTSYFFCYSIYWFCFVFSGLAYLSLVSGDNSNRKSIFSKCLQGGDFWLRLILVYVWTDENGGFRILYHDVIHHIPRELCMLRKGVLSYFHRFLNCVDGRKLWICYVWKRIFQGAGIKFPFSKTHSFFFYQNIFYKIIEAETCKILRLF